MEVLKIDPRYITQFSRGAEVVKPRQGEEGKTPPQEAGRGPNGEARATPSPREVASRQEAEKMREKLAERIKEYLRYQNWSVDLFIHEATRSVAAKIVDNDTGEVIKQIPPEEVLNLRARFMELIRELMQREEAVGR